MKSFLNKFRKFRKLFFREIIYQSYEQAMLACKGDSYESNDLTDVVVEKNLKYSLSTTPVIELSSLRILIALNCSSQGKKINVIDFGGGAGYHYTIIKKALSKENPIGKYFVVETKKMCAKARILSDNKLKFFDSIDLAKEEIKGVDLAFTSSALQYLPDSMSSLKKIIDLEATYLFITRTPFSNSQQVISIQNSNLSANGPGPLPSHYKDRKVSIPITYMNIDKVKKMILSKYDIIFELNEGMFNERFEMKGFLCVLRK